MESEGISEVIEKIIEVLFIIVSIELMPFYVNKRERLGDIKADLMMSKNHRGALLVMTDLSTLHTRLTKLQGIISLEVKLAMIKF